MLLFSDLVYYIKVYEVLIVIYNYLNVGLCFFMKLNIWEGKYIYLLVGDCRF